MLSSSFQGSIISSFYSSWFFHRFFRVAFLGFFCDLLRGESWPPFGWSIQVTWKKLGHVFNVKKIRCKGSFSGVFSRGYRQKNKKHPRFNSLETYVQNDSHKMTLFRSQWWGFGIACPMEVGLPPFKKLWFLLDDEKPYPFSHNHGSGKLSQNERKLICVCVCLYIDIDIPPRWCFSMCFFSYRVFLYRRWVSYHSEPLQSTLLLRFLLNIHQLSQLRSSEPRGPKHPACTNRAAESPTPCARNGCELTRQWKSRSLDIE